jgi:predicted ester cyclase
MELVDGLHPLAALLRRYAFAYTAAHDFAVCREIMVDDYVLRMGDFEIRGRDDQYIPATQKQYRQYPGLGFTVHELVLGEDRAAFHFTEHGRSTLHGGETSWQGVSLYRWNGERLVECRVEQDYHGRRTQQRNGIPHPVRAAGLDPWTSPATPADPEVDAVARQWLLGGGLAGAPIGALDDERDAPARRLLLSAPRTDVLDLFSAGPRVAFHTLTTGVYAGGLENRDHLRGRQATVYASGLLTVADGRVTDVHAVTDRLAAERRLAVD